MPTRSCLQICILIAWAALFSEGSKATTFAPVYPYKQWYEGQDIVVYTMPYSPYYFLAGGITKVYRRGTFLYVIDEFFTDPFLTSADGRYLFVFDNNFGWVKSPAFNKYGELIEQRISFHQRCIDVYKDGKLYKEWTLADVVDTTKFGLKRDYQGWMYSMDTDSFEHAQRTYDSCKKQYGRRYDLRYSLGACKVAYDSVLIKRRELKLEENSAYVENNEINILTSYNTIIKISIPSLTISEVTFSEVVPDKDKYDPPKGYAQPLDVLLPPKFSLPLLRNGAMLDTAIADFFKMRVSDRDNERYSIYTKFLIDKNGRASKVDCKAYFDSRNSLGKEDEKMGKELEGWITKQRFMKSAVPDGYDKYHYSDIIRLN